MPARSALAAELTATLTPATPFTCNVFDGCPSATISGSVSGLAPLDTFSLYVSLDPPFDFSDPQACFAPNAPNQLVLSASSTSDRLTLATAALCLPTDAAIESGPVSVPFTVVSGAGIYAGASGSGTLTGQFEGSILGDPAITVTAISSPDFTIPGSGGGPDIPPGATPELDSLALFAVGGLGLLGYVRTRRSARGIR